MIDAVQVRLAGTAGQFVAAKFDAREAIRRTPKIETIIVEAGAVAQFSPAQIHQHLLEPAAGAAAILGADTKLVLYFLVEVFQQKLARLDHCLGDLAGEVEPELFEAGLDLTRIAAVRVDVGDAAFKIDARADGAEHFVARPEISCRCVLGSAFRLGRRK
jgi:hypothetical protein